MPPAPPYNPADAMHHLYHDHHGWLQGWLRRKLGCTHQAADLAQDTFMRILVTQDERSVQHIVEPRAYLTTVAKRLVANYYQRQSLEQAYLDALALIPEAHVPSPETRLIILQTLHEIDSMLDALPTKARSAFLLSQLEGMSYAEIAGKLGVAIRTVKRYMAQGFEQCLLHMP